MISATQIYDAVQCPHRVSLDLWENPSSRDDPNPFVELLWHQGVEHEELIRQSLPVTADMSLVAKEDRERETRAAMARHELLIYRGRLTSGDLVGEPDLLELRGNGYIPGDIKSGSGLDGEDSEAKLKKHYAVQLAHYVLILEQTGLGDGSRAAFAIDRQGSRVPYVLTEPRGINNTQTWWAFYQEALAEVRSIAQQTQTTRGALSSVCKLCHWYSHCKKVLVAEDDLTLIAGFGRAKRDAMFSTFRTVHDFAVCDPETYFDGKVTTFDKISQDSLRKFHARAQLLSTSGASAYLKEPVHLPVARHEVYFDIEADPMRDVVYLHGFVERMHGQSATARFVPFFADGFDPAQEEEVFRGAWEYLQSRLQDSTIYYYSKYERTAYRKLARKYPDVCSGAEVESLFASPAMIDLYFNVVKKSTEWPAYDQSIKTLAQYLGFSWRDTHPSGAASIEWYHRWIESGDPAIKQRILDYNEDDCLATGVVVDGIRAL
ncbi:MAG: TM0106 family RecB-like putative nuclease [Gammaproteobacteria bacterium]|nr:TM0106 family RecB-like putative nuclease [Gammaproteobacteria bacterium]